MASDNLQDFLAGNEAFAAAFADGDKPLPPARKALVLACMDARLHPEKALGLNIGDCHCVRNAGGRAAEALRSIAISQRLLGTKEVIIIHHTDCGMLLFSDGDIKAKIREELGDAAGVTAEGVAFLPFADLAQSVRDDAALLRASPLVAPDTAVSGFVYDVRTGKLERVV